MKEIDFLPEWFKQGCVQQRSKHEFYVALGVIVFVMAVWGIFANGKVAVLKAKNTMLRSSNVVKEQSATGYSQAENEYQQLKSTGELLDSLKPHIVVSNVIAEIAFMLDNGPVLKKLVIKAEPIDLQGGKAGITSGAAAGQTLPTEKNTRFKITLAGKAGRPEQVADIINRLEQSDYFFQIVPIVSRNTTIGQEQVCEFEITCRLANYKLVN